MEKSLRKYLSNTDWRSSLPFSIIIIMAFVMVACEPWDNTAEVSHLSYTPQIEIMGEQYQSYVVTDSADYFEQGAKAFSNGVRLNVYSFGADEVDLTKVGVNTVFYYAENSDGIWAVAERVIAVTHKDISGNDLSGKYLGTIWDPVELKVSKLETDGFYKCDDIMGYSGAEMKGKFVDLGNHELVLIHGEGDFGRYAESEGDYTLSSLSWTIKLTDSPYNGLELPVSWIRKED